MSWESSRPNKVSEKKLVLVEESEVDLDGADTSSDDVVITEPFDPTKIRVDTKNTQMDALIKRIRRNEINLSPEFQRRAGIWKDPAQSRLIESMLIRIPLPAFYMDASDDERWLVVDGLQRLTAIRRYVIDQDLALVGLEFLVDFNGYKFDDLPRSFQRRIEETDIVVYQIQPGTPERVKFDIFRRINTGGEPLSPQEIRHALNQGKVTGFLLRLANSNTFKSATAEGVASKRMDDRECVLRFLAFCISQPEKYKADNFDGFLNDAMAKINKMSDAELKDLKRRFFRAMKAGRAIFGMDAFRKRYSKVAARHPINKALFEVWSVNLDALSDSEIKTLIRKKETLATEFINLMHDNEFEKSVTQGTGAIRRVHTRFRSIRQIIEKVIQ